MEMRRAFQGKSKGAYPQFVLIGSESCCGGDPELRIARGGHGFEGSTPTEVGLKVFGCVAMEASHPFLEASVVGVDVVDVEFRLFGLWAPGAGRTWILSLARLAKAVIAAPPSQQKSVEGGIRSPNASFRLAASRRGEDGVEGRRSRRRGGLEPPRPEFARPRGRAWRPCRRGDGRAWPDRPGDP